MKNVWYFGWLIIFLLTSCISAPSQPTPPPTATPSGEVATATPIVQPITTPTASPTAPPTVIAAATIPAPVYLIENDQVMRLEPDGQRLTQITHEPQPVRDMSVAANGTLVYLTGNDLVALDGNGRRVIFSEQAITNPRISPDGQRIVYHLANPAPGLINGRADSPAGVYLSQITGGRPELVIADDPVPETPDMENPAWRYIPVAWSPTGDRLLLYAVMQPEIGIPGGEAVIIGPDGQIVRAFSCCEEELWSVDGRDLAVAGGGPGPDIRFGLYLINADDGTETALLSADETTIPLVRAPQRLADGFVYAFVEMVPTTVYSWEYPFRPFMSRISDNGQITPLRPEPLTEPIAVLWDAQARGALIRFATTDPLIWLPTDPTLPPQPTIATGFAFTWVPDADPIARDCASFSPLSPQTDAARRYDPAVADIQARLAILGFDPGPADGLFGPTTARAVRTFRAAAGLPEGETIDCAAWQELFRRSTTP